MSARCTVPALTVVLVSTWWVTSDVSVQTVGLVRTVQLVSIMRKKIEIKFLKYYVEGLNSIREIQTEI